MAIDTANALISLADAKTQLKITGSSEDTILGDLINGVSDMCIQYLGRKLISQTYTEYYNGNGTNELLLRNFPIVSITSLYNADANRTFDATTLVDSSANVIIKKQSGIIELWNNGGAFLCGSANVKIVYVAGYSLAAIPYDIQLAVRKWVAQQYMRYMNKRYDVQSETVGENTVTYKDEDIPTEVKNALDPHKLIVMNPDFSHAD